MLSLFQFHTQGLNIYIFLLKEKFSVTSHCDNVATKEIIDWFMTCYFGMQLWQHHFEVFKSLTTLLNIVPIIWNPRKSLSPLYKSSSQLLGTIPGFKGYYDRKIGKTNNRKEKHLFKFFLDQILHTFKKSNWFQVILVNAEKNRKFDKGNQKNKSKEKLCFVMKKD